jgi:hypothetical protein
MHIELLHSPHCPNSDTARELLASVLRKRRIPDSIHEIVIQSQDDAVRVGFLGSPTIRIDGVDVDPTSTEIKGPALGCRLYDGTGVPARGLIETALRSREPR